MPALNLYVGTFLIALATLGIEVTLSRLLSVITWYHLAFFAVSTAMLGMTAGAVTVYLKSEWFTADRLPRTLAKACLGFALVVPVALIQLNLLPLGFERAGVSIMSVSAFVIATVASALPFYVSGIVIGAVLTRSSVPIGRVYAADLIGASMGCLLVLGGLEFIDASSLIVACGALGALAAFCYAGSAAPALRNGSLVLLVALAGAAFVNSASSNGIRPYMVKERLEDASKIMLERWNSYSRIVVYEPYVSAPQLWGPSPSAPPDPKVQFSMLIDGEAGTVVRSFEDFEDIEHLRYDVTNLAYFLRPHGGAAIIGVGGGRDLQSALLFGHERVIGVDVNRIFVEILQNDLADFAGLAGRDDVELVIDEARSYLSRTKERFSVIQMSLIDTWAATGAGAFSFTENGLYTIEAWQLFLSRLADDGIFTVSRWHSPEDLGESGRALSLATAALLESGAPSPSQHLAMVTIGNISTLMISKQPFAAADLAEIERVSKELGYEIALLPGRESPNAILRDIVSVSSVPQLRAVIDEQPLNYAPPTDDSPYFFNMLKLGDLHRAVGTSSGVVSGNLVATITLVVLLLVLAVLSAVTVIGPLLSRAAPKSQSSAIGLWPYMLYFSLLGTGFMLVEIALIQRLSVFLGHPTYALGVLLFTIILSTGIGSLCSEYLSVRSRWILSYPAIAATAIAVAYAALATAIDILQESSMANRILASVATLFPLGFVLGFFFPLGMRIAKSARSLETPWFWALNGVFGVLASVLAVLISIYFSITLNFVLGAACYLTLTLALSRMLAPAARVEPVRA